MKEIETKKNQVFVASENFSQKFVVAEKPKENQSRSNDHPAREVTAPVFEGVPTLGV